MAIEPNKMARENAKLRDELETARSNANDMVSFEITTHDFDGSVKNKLHELKLPKNVVPMGCEVIIQNIDTQEEHREFWLDSVKGDIQSEWVDDAQTKFVCVIDGRLKMCKIITRIYCCEPISSR